MQLLFLKTNILKGVKGWKKWQFTYFMAYIFARTERDLEAFCKIKDNDLSFEWMSFRIFELGRFLVNEFLSG